MRLDNGGRYVTRLFHDKVRVNPEVFTCDTRCEKIEPASRSAVVVQSDAEDRSHSMLKRDPIQAPAMERPWR